MAGRCKCFSHQVHKKQNRPIFILNILMILMTFIPQAQKQRRCLLFALVFMSLMNIECEQPQGSIEREDEKPSLTGFHTAYDDI